MSAILDAAHQALATHDDFIINFGLLFIVFCWIIGIIDVCRIGTEEDGSNEVK